MQKQNATLFIDGQKSDANLNFSKLSVGLHDKQFEFQTNGELFANGKLRIYRQPNSVVIGSDVKKEQFKERIFGIDTSLAMPPKPCQPLAFINIKGTPLQAIAKAILITTLTLPPKQGKGHLV